MKGAVMRQNIRNILRKKLKSILKKWWYSFNIGCSFQLGFSFLGIGRITATKILIICKNKGLPHSDGLKLYLEHRIQFDRAFEGVNLEGGVTSKQMKHIQNELESINIEEL